MVFAKYIMPLFFIAVGVVYFVLSINLPEAKLGNPNAPSYFPIMISVLITVSSVIYLFNVWRKGETETSDIPALFERRTLIIIAATLVLSIFYTLLFNVIGFLYSTLLFLGALLFVINGIKKWKSNIIVTVIFTYAAWYVFSELLNVSLP
ncbi:tripartite tricarboxylate transporter TctB family protein [Virgibacillus ihumii]|uniref:tripartite tricarboxylate transporter TctB family protein n=1 Tax=Virgibacillus ihumii TaxID=2686091 RepID=UPI00157C05B3|nr:tripartite tricarboxylate transporter TctB family protein [Virgibacillus ihumii]